MGAETGAEMTAQNDERIFRLAAAIVRGEIDAGVGAQPLQAALQRRLAQERLAEANAWYAKWGAWEFEKWATARIAELQQAAERKP